MFFKRLAARTIFTIYRGQTDSLYKGKIW